MLIQEKIVSQTNEETIKTSSRETTRECGHARGRKEDSYFARARERQTIGGPTKFDQSEVPRV